MLRYCDYTETARRTGRRRRRPLRVVLFVVTASARSVLGVRFSEGGAEYVVVYYLEDHRTRLRAFFILDVCLFSCTCVFYCAVRWLG